MRLNSREILALQVQVYSACCTKIISSIKNKRANSITGILSYITLQLLIRVSNLKSSPIKSFKGWFLMLGFCQYLLAGKNRTAFNLNSKAVFYWV